MTGWIEEFYGLLASQLRGIGDWAGFLIILKIVFNIETRDKSFNPTGPGQFSHHKKLDCTIVLFIR